MTYLPENLRREILERFMEPKELDSLAQGYDEAKKKRPLKEPSARHYKLAQLAQKKGVVLAAVEAKESYANVSYAVKRVATYNFLKNQK